VGEVGFEPVISGLRIEPEIASLSFSKQVLTIYSISIGKALIALKTYPIKALAHPARLPDRLANDNQ